MTRNPDRQRGWTHLSPADMAMRGAYLLERAQSAMAAGAWYDAQCFLREAVSVAPSSPAVHRQLGSVLLKLRLYEDAAIAYEQALMLAPEDFAASVGLAGALRAAGRPAEAADALHRALELRPESVPCLQDLAMLQLELGDLEAASAMLTRALALSPRHAGVYSSLAQLNAIRGRLEDAAWCAGKALECDPDYTPAVLKLAELDPGSALLDADRLEARLAAGGLSLPDRRNLGFAVGRVRVHGRKFRQAFAGYRLGNEAHRVLVERTVGPYDRGGRERQVERLVRLYSRQSLDGLSGVGLDPDRRRPIFVIGMTRSGTTLVEQMLSRHPDVFAAGERPALAKARDDFERIAVSSNGELHKVLPRGLIRTIAERYFEGLPQESAGVRHVVDKNPHNFWLVGLIAILFPEARIVHCRRDPVETCLSNYFQILSSHHNYSNRLEDLGHYYNQYRRTMAHWRSLGLENLFELEYEALIANPERSVRALLEHCRLDWCANCLEPHKATRPVFTPSQIQVRRPLYRDAIGRWRHFEADLGPLLEGPDAVVER